MKSQSENPNGLHRRYLISKADGSPVDPDAIYFVMRLDSGGKDPAHVEAGRQAANCWAQTVIEAGDRSLHLRQTAFDLLLMLSEFWKADHQQNTEVE